METRTLGALGLSLVVLGALAGCQQQTGSAPGGPIAATSGAQRPVSDQPDETVPGDAALPADRGVVTGRVRTLTGGPVVDAAVAVRSLDTPPVPVPELVVTTDEAGWFRWLLTPGRYELTVTPTDGARPVTVSAVDVRAGTERTVDVTVR
ncbi:carboxypeptidase-like regulatory domain-containing protein [Micromonospora sp. WMMD882]|uniref:carboxypeptidase-like regulatory domain-containing protein n=1 Tax=Micromonospora sp. WMMD882 TaxID=3015151 RepID=UPI00248B2ADF|nr:carboxypeptidase-like regulatory domain-containing protein [Micromonospora sp. WMMD882]WBB80125.1 carboxypeptidase-like regulatory domain-containing protein [Micromonospora sp. WMMD882]